jgi:pyridoxal 5'-phosphate synthase pdxT subunit
MNVHVSRNFFGSQLASFEQALPAHECLRQFGDEETYRAVFIRAPAILDADTDSVTVLSEYTLTESERARADREKVVVAAQSGHMLATAFHPELTEDTRWCASWPLPIVQSRGIGFFWRASSVWQTPVVQYK